MRFTITHEQIKIGLGRFDDALHTRRFSLQRGGIELDENVACLDRIADLHVDGGDAACQRESESRLLDGDDDRRGGDAGGCGAWRPSVERDGGQGGGCGTWGASRQDQRQAEDERDDTK